MKYRNWDTVSYFRVHSCAMPRKQKTIAIIGAGRVGRTLGKLLRERGWRIGRVVTRSQKTARAAVRAISAGIATSLLDADVTRADVVLIATPDRAIEKAAGELARNSARKRMRGKIFLHTN